MLIGLIVYLLLTIIVLVCVLLNKKEEEPVGQLERKPPEQVAEEMPSKEREELIKKFSSGTLPLVFGPNVKGEMTHLNIDYIEIDGVRYASIEEALEKNASLSEEVRYEMEVTKAELALLRREMLSAERFYQKEETVFDGTVYFYKEGIVGVKGSHADKAPRMAVEIMEDENGLMGVIMAFLAKEDIANTKNVYQFDLTTKEGREHFKTLVRDKKEYESEVRELDELIRRLNKYNVLMQQGRIQKTADGYALIPPTADEMKEVAKYDPSQGGNPVFKNTGA